MKVIIVGGSIGGLSAAVALRQEGCEVIVLERASKIVPAGAGLGLDPITCSMMAEAGFGTQIDDISRPIPVEEHRLVDHRQAPAQRKARSIVVNPKHNHRSFHWSDLHRMLYDSLPQGTVRFGHTVTAYKCSGSRVVVTALALDDSGQSREITFEADLLVAADGSNSTIRKLMHPQDKRRYAGMIAWRGVLMGDEHPDLLERLHKDLPHLHEGIIFDLSTQGGMNLIYMLPGNRVNWLWYRDTAEPELVGHSVTVKATEADIDKLHRDAEDTWTPVFAELIKTTKTPFINAIFDKEPLQEWLDGGLVVLLGEAAHPTTPHGSRSTNMSLQDSFTLGKCYREYGREGFLKEYQQARLPQTSQEVLFSRHVGELRQGRWVDTASFDWLSKDESIRVLLLNAFRDQPDYRSFAQRELQAKASCSNVAAADGPIAVS